MSITKRRTVPVVAPAPLRRVWPSVLAAGHAIGVDPRRLYPYLRRDVATGWWRLEPDRFRALLARHRSASWPHYRERKDAQP